MVKTGSNLTILDNPRAAYFAVLVAAAALYIASCAPGTLWQDSGMYQYRIWHNDIEGKLGLALAHPLYHIIGIAAKYIPLGEFAYRVNLISAIAGAIAVANLFLLLRLWLGKNPPALIGALTLALSWTTWQFASIAEVYTLHSALFIAELVMLFQYVKTKRVGYLYLLGLFNGLALSNHMWAAIVFVCYAVFLVVLLVKKQIGAKNFGIIVLLWVIGAAPYEYLIITNAIRTGDLVSTLSSAAFGNQWDSAVLNTSLSARIVKENLIFIAYNYPTPNILLFFVGLWGLYRLSPRRSFGHIILALLILFFVFAFRYDVPDRYAFFMPFYCLAPILIGLGYHNLVRRKKSRLIRYLAAFFTLLPIPAYIITPIIAEKIGFRIPTERTIPYRNDYIWFLRPWNGSNTGPERFATEALSSVEDNAIILADGTTVYALWYVQQVKGIKTGVKVLSRHGSYENPAAFPTKETIGEMMAKNPVCVVSPLAGYCPDYLLDGERYDFVKTRPIYRVVEKK